MWFKQLTAYRLPEKPDIKFLEESLSNYQFTPPAGLDWFNQGFAIPTPFENLLVFPADGHFLISLKREEKVLPASAVKNALQEKIEKINKEEARNVGRKERQELKEQITDDLLPRALSRISRTNAILTDGWLFVDNAAPGKAENLLTKLREALGGLNVKRAVTAESLSSLMTKWLINREAEGGFRLDNRVTLRGAGDVAPRVKISDKDLTDDDVRRHAENGLDVVELGLVWEDRISFVLTEALTLKNIRYSDAMEEYAENQDYDAAASAYSSQIIMTKTLAEMLEELVSHLGGWNGE